MKQRLLLLLIALLLTAPLFAQSDDSDETERILAFDSHVTVGDDGSMLVRETIKVHSTGERMQHGIFRWFPTAQQSTLGMRRTESFEIVAVERDGQPEAHHSEEDRDAVVVYFGSSDYLLPPGDHTYVFTYRTGRQLRFFPDHDELYWNATGHHWKFPIDVATTTVVFPERVRNLITALDAYTGYEGEKNRDYSVTRDRESDPVFRAEKLQPSQGITIVVSFPKGLLREPTKAEQRRQFVADNRAIAVGVTGLALALLYYTLAWMMVGRDPKAGTIVPLYEPQDNLSPAAMRYLERMGFDDKTFTAAVLGLAARGYLTIQQDKHSYTLHRKSGYGVVESKLAADEKTLARKLFASGDTLHLTEHNSVLQAAQRGLQDALKAQEENVYFLTNSRYLIPGVVLTALAVGLMVVLGGGAGVGIFMSVWLSGWTFGVVALALMVYHAWKAVHTGAAAIAGAVFTTVFALPFFGGEIFGITILWKAVGALPVAILFAGVFSGVLFHFLLKAPTKAGRTLMDRVEGFRMFLKAVDGDRINRMSSPPDKTPELFERFLPYALALDVEHAWAEQFTQVLATSAGASSQSQSGYSPTWYSGAGVGAFSATGFTSSFGSSFSSAMASATSSASASGSGGGGGGSSGGGGGGGGGGGW